MKYNLTKNNRRRKTNGAKFAIIAESSSDSECILDVKIEKK